MARLFLLASAGLKTLVEKLLTGVRLQFFRLSTLFKDRLEGVNHLTGRLLFQSASMRLFGKHVDDGQQILLTVVVLCQGLRVAQISLELLHGFRHKHSVSTKTHPGWLV